MAVTREELTRFREFAELRLDGEDADSIEQLVGLWRLANRTPEEAADDLASIRRGIADADAGRTLPVGEAFNEVRSEVRSRVVD